MVFRDERGEMEDVTAIILSGGSGSRLSAGSLIPKALLPAWGRPLILRTIAQLANTRLSRILIYTTPPCRVQFSAALRELDLSTRNTVSVICNDSYQNGPISALLSLRRRIKSRHCLLILSDIVHAANPFLKLPSDIDPHRIYLGCAPAPRHAPRTAGVVQRIGSRLSLVERPTAPLNTGLLWSGMALFSTDYLRTRAATMSDNPGNAPIGELFASAKSPYSLARFPVPSFINVNTPADFLAAQLLLLAEDESEPSPLRRLSTRLRLMLQTPNHLL